MPFHQSDYHWSNSYHSSSYRSDFRVWTLLVVAVLSGLVSCRRNSPASSPLPPLLSLDTYAPGLREQAQPLYQGVLQQPDSASANGSLGMALEANLQHEAAVTYLERAHHLNPNSFAWTYCLGLAQAAQGHNADAISSLRDALHLNPTYRPAELRLGECLLAAGKPDESAAVYEMLRQQYPLRTARADFEIGHVRATQGQWNKAQEAFAKACQDTPSYGKAHYGLAQAFQALGRQQEAQQHLRQYKAHKETIPQEQDPVRDEMNQYDRSFGHFARAGYELNQKGEFARAAEAYEMALQDNPQHLESHVSLVHVYQNMGQFDKAMQHYRAAMRLNPNDVNCHYNYAVLLVRQNKPAEAIAEFRRAAQINPKFAEAYNNLGYLLEKQGRLAEAQECYQQAVRLLPEYPLAHYHLGELLVRRNQAAAGIREMQRSLSPEDESTPTFLYGLAKAYTGTGQKAQARIIGQKARDAAAARQQTALAAQIAASLQKWEH